MKHLQLKRFTGLLLALIMLLGMVPVSAAPAAADTYVSNIITPIPMDEPEPEEESDPFADLETEEDFLASFRGQTFKGPYNERLVAVAETQLGYTESERNFIYKEENGEKQKMGYTRYGAWYGPGFDYESWCAMFISFCLHYAEVPEELMPRDSGVITWMHTLQRSGLYRERGEYMAKPGDLIFFDWDLDGRGDHVGIVHSTFWQDGVEMVRTIEGNHTRTVEYFTYPRYSYEIMGYGCTPYEDPDAVKALFTTDYLSLDGSTYRVTLTCDSDAGIPKGTQLSVSEVSSDPYLASTAEALGLGEEDILVYTRFFDIKLIKDGVEIEPLTPVQVSVDLLDMETPAGSDGVQVVHFAEDGTKALDGSSEDGSSVTFMADSFSVYGFGVALRPVAKEESSLADVTLYSTSPSSAPSVSQPELDAPVEGLETMSVLTVGSSDETGGKTFVRASLKDASALSEAESLALYTVESNRVTDVLVDSLSADAKLISLPASTEGVALVKDTGYRRLSFETEEVALTGMMPKASDAQVQNVTSAYAAFQPASDPAEDLSLNPEEVSDPTVLAAYTISLTDNGTAYTPDDSRPLQVSFTGEAIVAAQTRGSDLTVWQLSADGTETPVTDVTATDGALSFTATDVSTYVITERKLKQTITASDGNTYEITVSYDSESGLPTEEEGAHLSVTEILNEEELAEVTAAIDSERAENRKIAVSRTFDIKILDKDGNEVQPNEGANVHVTFELVQVGNPNLTTDVYHIRQDGAVLTAESLDVTGIAGNTATVNTTGFSYFTVEFTYEGKQYVLPGDGSSIKLSDLLAAIGITGEVTDIELSNDYLIVLYKENDEWYVTGEEAFDTEEWMRVTVDGIVYEIVVTDDFLPEAGTGNTTTDFAKNLDVATLRIADLSSWTNKTVSAVGLVKTEGESNTAYGYKGALPSNVVKSLGNSSLTVTYHNAATAADETTYDVKVIFDNIKLYTWRDEDIPATKGNKEYSYTVATSKGMAGNCPPDPSVRIRTNILNSEYYMFRFGVEEDITVKIVDANGNSPANETFVLSVYDLNLNKTTSGWYGRIYDADNHERFSEMAKLKNGFGDVYYNSNGNIVKLNGTTLRGNGGGVSWASGFAGVVKASGATFTICAGGGAGSGAGSEGAELFIMTRSDRNDSITHAVTSDSGIGGSISTTTTGAWDTTGTSPEVPAGAKELPGGTATKPYTYDVPSGKQVSYLIKPDQGYVLDTISVDGKDLVSYDAKTQTYIHGNKYPEYLNLKDNSGNAVTPALTGDESYYLYTFPAVNDTHRISVTWRQVPTLTVTKTITGDLANLSEEFQFTVSGLRAGSTYNTIRYTTADGINWTVTPSSSTSPRTLTADSSGNLRFTLGHYQKIDIMMPGISAVGLTENNGDYIVKYCLDNGAEQIPQRSPTTTISNITYNDQADPPVLLHTVAFTNNFPAVAPTGVRMHTSPFTIMLLAGMMLLFPAAYRGRKRKKDSNI